MNPESNDIPYSSYGVDFFGGVSRALSNAGLDGLLAFLSGVFATLLVIWNIYTVFAFLLSALLLYGIIYTMMRANQIDEVFERQIAEAEEAYRQLHGGEERNWRWAEVIKHIGNDTPNDWKLAIIEADILLGEALDSAGYAGTSIGEQLKSISPSALGSLDAAWQAHKVRNQIAHSGTDFVLTKKLAQDTIGQYRQVFEEMGVI